MKIIGIAQTMRDGRTLTTIHGLEPFETFFNSPPERISSGQKAVSVYVGGLDCSGLEVGMEIEILYDKAITTARGTFQPVKRIEVISKK